MFAIDIKLLENYIPELEKRLKALEKQETMVGYFREQGKHYSGLTYPDLVAIHANGSTKQRIPPRDIFGIAYTTYNINKSPLKKDLTLYLKDLTTKPSITVRQIRKNWALDFGGHVKPIFGSSQLKSNSPFTQSLKQEDNVKPNNPLVWYGDLRDNLSYKIDIGHVKYYGI